MTLPPGRLRLLTSPVATGSPPIANTIGIVVVAAFAASAAGVPLIAAITATAPLDQIGRQRRQLFVIVPPPSGIRIATLRPS